MSIDTRDAALTDNRFGRAGTKKQELCAHPSTLFVLARPKSNQVVQDESEERRVHHPRRPVDETPLTGDQLLIEASARASQKLAYTYETDAQGPLPSARLARRPQTQLR